MRVTAIKLARAIALFDIDELSPAGQVSLSKIAPSVVAKFGFQKSPSLGDQIEENKGVEFFDGQWDGLPVTRFAVFNDGIIVDTRASTTESFRVLIEALEWAKDEHGIGFSQNLIRRRRYLSTFSFESDAPVLTHSLPATRAAQSMTELMKSISGRTRTFEGIRIDIDFDHYSDKEPVASFTIQRLALEPFEANRYFTQAPLPTDSHISLIQQFEADVLSMA